MSNIKLTFTSSNDSVRIEDIPLTIRGKVRLKRLLPDGIMSNGIRNLSNANLQIGDYLEWMPDYAQDGDLPNLIRSMKQVGLLTNDDIRILRTVCEDADHRTLDGTGIYRINGASAADWETIWPGVSPREIEMPHFLKSGTNYSIEIAIEKQPMAGNLQPRVYVRLPIENLKTVPPLAGRPVRSRERCSFLINRVNKDIAPDIVQALSLVSETHNCDMLGILNGILDVP